MLGHSRIVRRANELTVALGIQLALLGFGAVAGARPAPFDEKTPYTSDGRQAVLRTSTLTPAPFDKREPHNGAAGQPLSLTLKWLPSASAESYEYCYDANNNNACDSQWISSGTSTSAGLTGLSSYTNYYWQVRARNSFGTAEAVDGWWVFRTRQAVLAPTELRVASIVGNLVTLRWRSPDGLPPTRYVIEAGVQPGEVLATLPTADAHTAFTFSAPTGSYYIRVVALHGDDRGAPSNEVRLFVNVPQPPSPPTTPLVSVNGRRVSLAWANTFEGGAPTAVYLQVNGSADALVTLPLSETVTLDNVPSGFYTVRVRASNASGLSLESGALTFSVPATCTPPTEAPANLLAYAIGRTLHVIWDPPEALSSAPTAYALSVTGMISGSTTTAHRAISAPVQPGLYTFTVFAVNECGAGPVTGQSIVVP